MDINTMDTNRATSEVGEILDAFRVLVAALASASRTSEMKHGVTGAQYFVLQKLREGGEMSVNELAERTHTHQSTVSTVVTKLVNKGLVRRQRSESDARVQMLSLSTEGRQRLRKPVDTIQDRLIRAISELPVRERRQLSRLLKDVLAGAGLDAKIPELFLESKAKPSTVRKERA